MDSSGVGKRKRFSFAEKYEILKELDAGGSDHSWNRNMAFLMVP